MSKAVFPGVAGSMPARLREERVRIGLDQKALATALSVGTHKVVWAESPAGEPLTQFDTSHWACMGSLRMDIQYIMAGQRVMRPSLSRDEETLLTNYRCSTAQQKDHLEPAGPAAA